MTTNTFLIIELMRYIRSTVGRRSSASYVHKTAVAYVAEYGIEAIDRFDQDWCSESVNN